MREAKFLQKYKTSPVDFLLTYMTSPETPSQFTIPKIIHDISSNINGIDIKDILSDGIVRGVILCNNGAFYPAIYEEITL